MFIIATCEALTRVVVAVSGSTSKPESGGETAQRLVLRTSFSFPLNHALHIMHTTLFIYTKVHFFSLNVLFSCSTKPRLQWRLYVSCHNAALVVVCLFILLKSLSVLHARRIHRLIQFLVTLNTSSSLYWSCLWAVTWIMHWDGHLLCFTVAAIWIMTMQTILF